jgi:CIC family chloride channel protein
MLIVLGALAGVVAGFAAVLFVWSVDFVNSAVWGWSLGGDHEVPSQVLAGGEHAGQLPAWYPLVVVPVGLLLVIALVRRFAPAAGGHGVPEVMEAVALRSGLMKGRVGVVKLLASSINIGLGGSVGKEGPIVQVGAAFASALSRLFVVRGRNMRTLVGCGAAAGIAAVFNAPIGGVMFALEIIIGSYNLSSFSPVLIASVAGAVTSRTLLGTEPAFAIPDEIKQGLSISSPYEFGAYVLLGLLFGVAAVGFNRTLLFIEDRAAAWRFPIVLKALVAGLLVGAMGMNLPQLLGEGHHSMTEVLTGSPESWPWLLLAALAVLKTVATGVTLAGGGSGGVFAPSLFVGAMLGALFGQLMNEIFPGQVGAMGGYALVGMAALLAGSAHAPLTAILLLFEMSDNYLVILPLMTASVISTVVSQRLMPDSIYTVGLARRGIVLRDHEDSTLLRRLRVADAMQPPVSVIPDTTTFDRIVRRVMQSDRLDFPVVDAEGHLTGVLSLDDLREFLRDDSLDHLLLARDCARPTITLRPQDTLLYALESLDQNSVHDVPVVSGEKLVGSLRRGDVLRTYRRALAAASAAGGNRPSS